MEHGSACENYIDNIYNYAMAMLSTSMGKYKKIF